MAVILPAQGGATVGTVVPTEMLHVSNNGFIMRTRAALKALATVKENCNLRTRVGDARHPWLENRLREGHSDKKTNAEDGCTGPKCAQHRCNAFHSMNGHK